VFYDRKTLSDEEKKLDDISKSVDLDEEEKVKPISEGDKLMKIDELRSPSEMGDESFQQRY